MTVSLSLVLSCRLYLLEQRKVEEAQKSKRKAEMDARTYVVKAALAVDE